MLFLSTVLSRIVTVLFFLSSLTATLPCRELKPVNAEDIKLCFATISDLHIQETDARITMLSQGFKVLSDDDVDAVVCPGDLTDHGNLAQQKAFFECAKNLDGPELIPAIGNHDTWANDVEIEGDSAEISLKYFVDCFKDYSGRVLEKPYYTTDVNGYKIICLASMADKTYSTIPEDEIAWLDAQLSEATATGMPAFVICHWPLNGVNGQDEIWPEGVFGDSNDAVEAVLNKYKNVFFISGHLHAGFTGDLTRKIKGYSSIETKGNVHYINLPSYQYMNFEAGNPLSGCGYIVEVYENEVLFRARNIALEYWMPTYDATIPLV